MRSILVIDDQSIVRELIADLLREFELADEIFEAKSLKETQTIMQKHQLSAIVADINLVDGNILDLLANMQKHGYILPPTLLLSGLLSNKNIQRAKALGILHTLNKPLRPDTLIEQVEKLLMPLDTESSSA